MNKSQIAKYGSFGSLETFFTNQESSWKDFPLLGAEIKTFLNLKAALEATFAPQSAKTAGITEGKNAKFNNLSTLSLSLSKKARVWARKNNHHEALAVLNVSATDFNTNKLTLLNMARDIHKVLDNNFKALESSLITEAQIKALKDQIDEAHQRLSSTVVAKGQKIRATAEQSQLFAEIDSVLLNITDLIEGHYEDSNKALVDQYHIAQKVSSLPVRHTALRGKVTDAEGKALSGAYVDLLEIDGEETHSDPTGFYEIKEFRPGHYTVAVSKAGYTSYQGTLSVKLGQSQELNVGLGKE